MYRGDCVDEGECGMAVAFKHTFGENEADTLGLE